MIQSHKGYNSLIEGYQRCIHFFNLIRTVEVWITYNDFLFVLTIIKYIYI